MVNKALARFVSELGTPIDSKHVKDAIKAHGDTGEWVEAMCPIGQGGPAASEEATLESYFREFISLAHMKGAGSQEQKVVAMIRLLRRVHPIKGGLKYTARSLLCKLRIGVTIKTVIASLATTIASRHSRPEGADGPKGTKGPKGPKAVKAA